MHVTHRLSLIPARHLCGLLALAAAGTSLAATTPPGQNATIESTMRDCGGSVTRNAALDQAATRYANGTPLGTALSQSSYMYNDAQVLQTGNAQVLLQGLSQRCSALRRARDYGLAERAGTFTLLLAEPKIAAGTALTPASVRRILDLTNAARAKGQTCGGKRYAPAPALVWNDALASAAQQYAQWQAARNLTGHVDATLGTPGDRAVRAGWRGNWGENLSYGPGSPEAAVESWLKSPAHCQNLMNPAHRFMGAGVATNPQSTYGTYWGQMFGS